jgi:hypothetical protein
MFGGGPWPVPALPSPDRFVASGTRLPPNNIVPKRQGPFLCIPNSPLPDARHLTHAHLLLYAPALRPIRRSSPHARALRRTLRHGWGPTGRPRRSLCALGPDRPRRRAPGGPRPRGGPLRGRLHPHHAERPPQPPEVRLPHVGGRPSKRYIRAPAAGCTCARWPSSSPVSRRISSGLHLDAEVARRGQIYSHAAEGSQRPVAHHRRHGQLQPLTGPPLDCHLLPVWVPSFPVLSLPSTWRTAIPVGEATSSPRTAR